MTARPPNRGGLWYLLSITDPLVLYLALRGLLGAEARDSAEVALADLTGAVTSRPGQAILAALTAVVVVTAAILLYLAVRAI